MEKYCSEEQNEILRPLAKGRVIGAFCLSQKQEVMQLLKKQLQLIKGSLFVKRYKNWITNGVLHLHI
jgi:alkylation response protein AidB-like acyl-CoA dehydrogenase